MRLARELIAVTVAGVVLAPIGAVAQPSSAAGDPHDRAAAIPGEQPTAAAARLGTGDARLQTRLDLTSISPLAPQPGDQLTISGTIADISNDPIRRLGIELWLNAAPIGNRSDFDSFAHTATSVPFATDGLSQVTAATSVPLVSALSPNASESWSITVPVDSLDLPTTAWSTYELGVAAVAGRPAKQRPVGRLRTFLPFAPSAVRGADPVKVSWLWPLVDQPHRSVASTGQDFTDDTLASSLSPSGRLGRLIEAADRAANQRTQQQRAPIITHKHGHKHVKRFAPPPPRLPVDVTYAIDPMLLEDAKLMSAGYSVRTASGTHAGTGRAAATSWLSSLSAAVDTGSVIALPYADPDIVAAVRAGQDRLIQTAETDGQQIVSSVLGTARLLSGWAWPPGGFVNSAALEEMYAGGTFDVVLDGRELPQPASDAEFTANAHVPLQTRDGQQLTGLLDDPTLSQVVQDGSRNDSGLALQRYLAETLMIVAESPSTQRSIVVAPNRRWDPSERYAQQLLDDTGRVPWIEPSTLPAAAEAKVDRTVPRHLTYPAVAEASELPASYVAQVGAASAIVDQLEAVLPRGNVVDTDDEEGVWQALSSSWRENPGGAESFVEALTNTVRSTRAQVYIGSRRQSLVTLTSHSGTVPITVVNNLDQPVRVRVVLDAGQKVTFPDASRQVQTIPAHDRFPVDVKFETNTSGRFPLHVQLFEPNDTRTAFGPEVTLYVRSTVYGTVALIITAAALALLFIAVVTRLLRRGLRSRRSAKASA